jgi:phosphatidylserine/phosphatidylglycerophosphate/cardiolipin synthase-like enzyme
MPRKKQLKLNPKWSLPSLILVFLLAVGYQAIQEFAFPVIVHENTQTQIKACFTPDHNCQNQIIRAINHAENEILVLCYYLSAEPIASALVEAARRGVNIQIVADRSQREASSSLITSLKNKGIPIWIDESVAIAHNKVMVIDEKMVITGSYNLTNAAEDRNAENILFIQSKELADQYKRYWKNRREHATPLLNTQ